MRMGKKAIAILLCVCFIASMFATPVFAGDANFSFVTEKNEVTLGDTFTVTISNKEMNLNGIGAQMDYDKNRLEVVSVTPGDMVPAVTSDYTTVDGRYSFFSLPVVDTTFKAGTISTVTFKAVAAGEATITLTEKTAGINGFEGLAGNATIKINEKVVEPEEITVTGVSLNVTNTTLVEGETVTLVAIVEPSNATDKTVTWTSSNTGVVTVDATGKVTAVKAGTATITATTANGKTATCTVTVKAPIVPVGAVTITTAAPTLTVGQFVDLAVKVTPDNATNKNVAFESSNPTVATVDDNGKVTAVGVGEAIITVKAQDGSNKAATVKVTVKPVAVTGVILNSTSAELKAKGETVQLTATVNPSNATDKTVTWKSSNPAVATVDANGVVKAVANGTATITAKAGDKTATCTVKVNIPPVTVAVTGVSLNADSVKLTAKGETKTLTATVNPSNATDKTVTWKSSNTAVATVENGVVKAVGNGTTTITVTTKDGGFTDTCNVEVKIVSKPSGGGGSYVGSYNYPVDVDADGAKITVSDNYAAKGDTVIITVTPDAGKQVDKVIVTDNNGKEITVTKVGDNKYSFVMPAGKVNVDVTTKAIDYDKKIILQINNNKVYINDRVCQNDVVPFIETATDRTMVPIRVVIEALGGTADWDEATRTVTLTIDGKVLTMTIDQVIPGFGAAPIIVNDRTYVPIRYVAEEVGAHVEWIAETQQIIIRK